VRTRRRDFVKDERAFRLHFFRRQPSGPKAVRVRACASGLNHRLEISSAAAHSTKVRLCHDSRVINSEILKRFPVSA
jgi:hypothetical protein